MKPAAQLELPLIDRAQLALRQSPHLMARNVQLVADQGRVILRGVVRSYFQKQMAQEALRRIEGVESIENHLQVHWR
jgi:osmotically-inducible protein OsmY